ncbi:MAG: BMP family ABC transporter substrate-binding protein [Spirochaetales bacterium]|nr:BMP family ABC transporter substrate-binding protein [Spirochaetales bacterium]
MQKKTILILLLLVPALLVSAKGKSEERYDIAVFVPGVVDGSPTYEMLVQGVQKAVSESAGAGIKVIEGGFNQGEWQEKLTSLAATGQFELIVSSNPAIPEICAKITEFYPKQKFLLLDGYLPGNTAIYTFRYNQFEQGYLIGYFGAMFTDNLTKGKNSKIRLGLIAGQEYPDMNLSIRPGFERGLKDYLDAGSVDFRVLGNWYDAAKAAELANSMYDQGVDVILSICGGASQGIIKTAGDRHKYVLWFDNNGYSIAPGVIIGCSGIAQTDVAYEKTKAAIQGKLPFGTAEFEGVREKRVFFIDDDPLAVRYAGEDLISRMREIEQQFYNGTLGFPMGTE